MITYQHWTNRDPDSDDYGDELWFGQIPASTFHTMDFCCEITGKNHVDVMTQYYKHMDFGTYFPIKGSSIDDPEQFDERTR